jgi:FkbH-like protein
MDENKQTLAIAATFTAEPVEEVLGFWMRELEISANIQFASFNQVFQQLLDPHSLLSTNRRGLNVLFIRLEDLERVEENTSEDSSTIGEVAIGTSIAGAAATFPLSLGERAGVRAGMHNTSPGAHERLDRTTDEFIQAIKSAGSRGSTPYLVCLCPPSKSALSDPEHAKLFKTWENRLVKELAHVSGVYLVTSEELFALYPVLDYDDPRAEELGHIPYTPLFFSALGTMLARRFRALNQPAFKVIVLDCDQTLWTGVCGEEGSQGIQLDPPRVALQQFMLAQSNTGMLLCLCSKNNEQDVFEVFEQRSEMPLRREHLAAWRINWKPKSENLRSLANELRLGLDSFIFIDDNPVECAEVEANCPEVLTLQLPEPPELIPQFLAHCWAFDHLKLSAEDTQRTVLYQQDRQRHTLRAESLDLASFVASLNLQIVIAPMSEEQITRVAQLTQRTNQFNFTTRRYLESDIQSYRQIKTNDVLTVSVKDRFGDYGLVGLILYEVLDRAVNVDTFLLSCRVLAKGVEHRMLSHLGKIALGHGAETVDLHFLPSPKNQPAFSFLEGVGAQFKQAANGGYLYRFPADFAAALVFNPGAVGPSSDNDPFPSTASSPAASASLNAANKFSRCRWIAMECSDPARILRAARASMVVRSRGETPFTGPRTETEKLLCNIWKDLLRVDCIGIHDNFFHLGGDSLIAVQLFSQIDQLTGRTLPLVTLFESPTIEKLASILEDKGWQPSWTSLVPIKPNGSNPPFYCVHGVGGNILEFEHFSRYIHPEQPLYGIQAQGLDGKRPRHKTVAEMAAHYIKEIQEFQPEGPYYLGGSSFGGLVAYEIAQQLSAQGQPIGLLIMFDTRAPGYPKLLSGSTALGRKLNHWRFRFGLHWSNLREAKGRAKLQYILAKSVRTWKYKIRKRLIKAKQNVTGTINNWLHPRAIRQVRQGGHRAETSYGISLYSGKVTLLRATEQPLGIYEDRTNGWTSYALGGVEVHDVPGHHGSIMREPRARILVQKLTECLIRAYQADASPDLPSQDQRTKLELSVSGI